MGAAGALNGLAEGEIPGPPRFFEGDERWR
jgi:hypothetical protein